MVAADVFTIGRSHQVEARISNLRLALPSSILCFQHPRDVDRL